MIGVEAAGVGFEHWEKTRGLHRWRAENPGVLHGSRSYLLQRTTTAKFSTRTRFPALVRSIIPASAPKIPWPLA